MDCKWHGNTNNSANRDPIIQIINESNHQGMPELITPHFFLNNEPNPVHGGF
jgi:hypothetical protein